MIALDILTDILSTSFLRSPLPSVESLSPLPISANSRSHHHPPSPPLERFHPPATENRHRHHVVPLPRHDPHGHYPSFQHPHLHRRHRYPVGDLLAAGGGVYSRPHGLTDRAALIFHRPGVPCEEIAEPIMVLEAGEEVVEKGEGEHWGG